MCKDLYLVQCHHATYEEPSTKGGRSDLHRLPVLHFQSLDNSGTAAITIRRTHLSATLSGTESSVRTCDADYEQLAILSNALSKPYADFCPFSKTPDIIYYSEVTTASFTTFILCESPLIPTSALRLPRFSRNTSKSFLLVAMNQCPCGPASPPPCFPLSQLLDGNIKLKILQKAFGEPKMFMGTGER